LMTQPVVLKLLAGTGDPGGFEHNVQSLRIVDQLEGHRPEYPGLNLTWEVREGICKHRFTPGYRELEEFQATPQLSLESQIADIADEIAYDCHDVDDGLRAGLLTIDNLADNPLWRDVLGSIQAMPGLTEPADIRYRAVKTLIDELVTNVVESTLTNLSETGVRSPDDVRNCARPLVDFSPEIKLHAGSLKTFLYTYVYYHFQVVRMKEKARRLIQEVFNAYLEEPQQLPSHIQKHETAARVPLPRAICDYIAGMTDRYAVDEHRKLFDIDVRLLP